MRSAGWRPPVLLFLGVPAGAADTCAFAAGFPARLQQSDLDIALPAGTGDEEYMQVRQGVRVRGAALSLLGLNSLAKHAPCVGVGQGECSAPARRVSISGRSPAPAPTPRPRAAPRSCATRCRRCWRSSGQT